jgi:hypothetical protein
LKDRLITLKEKEFHYKKSVWHKVKVLLFVITDQFRNIQLTWGMLLSFEVNNTVANATKGTFIPGHTEHITYSYFTNINRKHLKHREMKCSKWHFTSGMSLMFLIHTFVAMTVVKETCHCF